MVGTSENQPKVATVVEQPYPGGAAPAELTANLVSLVELCHIAMPNPAKLRESILGAGFEVGPAEKAQEAGAMLALDTGVIATPVRNLTHEIFGRNRQGEFVTFLISQGDTDDGKVVFCSTFFRGAIEADAVKAAVHVMNKPPFTGAKIKHGNSTIRRTFWDAEGVAGVRGFMVTGPLDIEATHMPRAFTVFNKAGR